MSEHNRIFIGGAFLAGVLVTIAIKELHRQQFGTAPTTQTKQLSSSSHDEDLLSSVRSGPPSIVEGVEMCIGNTPLFRIKSLSDETGCEILAKAEVRTSNITICREIRHLTDTQYLNGAGGSPKDRVALSMIETVSFESLFLRGAKYLMHLLG